MIPRSMLAQHFYKLTRFSRKQLLLEGNHEPRTLKGDAATMFAGYVGENYIPGKGLLLFGNNPGGGGNTFKRNAHDNVFYPLLTEFKRSGTEEAFEMINKAFPHIAPCWGLWRIFGPTLKAAGKTIDEVAYMNVFPYRTQENKAPPVAAKKEAWNLIVGPTLNLLAPYALVNLGFAASKVVDDLDTVKPYVKRYDIKRTNGDTYICNEARTVHQLMTHELCGEVN